MEDFGSLYLAEGRKERGPQVDLGEKVKAALGKNGGQEHNTNGRNCQSHQGKTTKKRCFFC